MRAGFMLPLLHPLELNESTAQMAIDAGYDSLWLPDHLLGVYPPQLWREVSLSSFLPDADAWLDPFCVAAIFSRKFDVSLGTGVTDSVRRRPADIARTMLTLQHANKRGFILGIGTGEIESTIPFGYDFDKPVAKLEAFLIELRTLLTTVRMPHGPGRNGLPLQSDAGSPQIWIAAHGPRMQRLTGRYGDGWLPLGLSPDDYGEALTTIRESAQQYGRKAPIASMVAIAMFSSSRARLVSQIEQTPLAKMLALFASADVWRRYGLEHPAGPHCRGFVDVVPHAIDPQKIRKALERVPIEMFEEFVLLGNADEVVQQISRWTAKGLEHVVIANYSGVAGPIEEAFSHIDQVQKLPASLAAL